MPTTSRTDVETTVRRALAAALGLSADRADAMEADTSLLGALPELDSMAVATLLTEVEDQAGIVIDDDEVDGEMLETFGSLVAFVARKRDASTPA